ncbi:hypothetical protein EVAR_23568_1 [Eumeta japonica]|uniref:Uncharacterized protein n=1 Tax=Eumeta variegata TaxID=151549 RepID=A0A4C1X098_EUMVA|nr:hypothetical protein EVAR_23568_1 [Eumeta japonica]
MVAYGQRLSSSDSGSLLEVHLLPLPSRVFLMARRRLRSHSAPRMSPRRSPAVAPRSVVRHRGRETSRVSFCRVEAFVLFKASLGILRGTVGRRHLDSAILFDRAAIMHIAKNPRMTFTNPLGKDREFIELLAYYTGERIVDTLLGRYYKLVGGISKPLTYHDRKRNKIKLGYITTDCKPFEFFLPSPSRKSDTHVKDVAARADLGGRGGLTVAVREGAVLGGVMRIEKEAGEEDTVPIFTDFTVTHIEAERSLPTLVKRRGRETTYAVFTEIKRRASFYTHVLRQRRSRFRMCSAGALSALTRPFIEHADLSYSGFGRTFALQ